jgi:SAM-dependent methyltransferase
LLGAPSPFVLQHLRGLPAGARALDVACGAGRHVAAALAMGLRVVALDRDTAAVRGLACPELEVVESDLEAGPWPLPGLRFDAVVVTNYLWRPLLPAILDSVQAGGMLIYSTFLVGQERFGRPRNPDFLLRENELPDLVAGAFEVVAFEQGAVEAPAMAMRQSIAARRLSAAVTTRSR